MRQHHDSATSAGIQNLSTLTPNHKTVGAMILQGYRPDQIAQLKPNLDIARLHAELTFALNARHTADLIVKLALNNEALNLLA